MLSQSSILYRQARTLSSFSASLCVRICSSQLCKNLGVTKRHEPRVDKVLDTAKRSFELRYRSLSTASCYLKESRTTTDEPLDTLKDESNLNSGFFDEEDADISNLQKTRSKLRSAFAEYTLDEDGYMNIQDLVEFLRRESAIDICVIKTRGNRQTYVDYFVVVSGVSTRHIRAMAKNLEQLFKGRELRGIGQTGHVGVEGMESNHWVVLDIGNIVVHFFLPEVREVYELEKLWTLGPKYDDQSKAYLEEEILCQAAEFGIKLDDPDADGENPVVDELGRTLDDPRRY